MADIATRWSGEGADWAVVAGALQAGDDLATAVLLSLFTDRQANADDAVLGGDRRGWWGDPAFGSRLWLLARAKRTDDTARLAEEYAQEGLAWLLSDGVVALITATAAWQDARTLAMVVQLQRTDGTTRSLNFAWAWNGLGLVTQPVVLAPPAPVADFSDASNSGLLAAL